jgi:hypothetical protein
VNVAVPVTVDPVFDSIVAFASGPGDVFAEAQAPTTRTAAAVRGIPQGFLFMDASFCGAMIEDMGRTRSE